MADVPSRLSTALADRYRLERRLGEGGMATVYLAEDLKHKRKVAIKVLRPELAAVLGAERFVQEITTTASLQHPHILPLFDSGRTGGTAEGRSDEFLYYVMPYVEGETLRQKLNRETQLGIDEAVKITTEVADALDYAHRQGVIHRDIKPENILLHDGRPMVADFGIALAVSAAAGGRITETGLSLGTPHYMSPEQATAEKDLTSRSDIYSLGVVLYEMLAGAPPHLGGSAQQIIMKIVTDEARPVTELRKNVPPNVTAAVAKALEKLPADRFESAASFAHALGDPSFDVPTGTSRVAAATASRTSRFWIAATVVAAIAAIAATAAYVLRAPPPRPNLHAIIPLPHARDSSASEGLFFEYHISPDGRYMAVSGAMGGSGAGLFVRALDSLDWRFLPGSGTSDFFWSPDSRSLAFFGPGQLRAVGVGGGPVEKLADVGPGDRFSASGAWSRKNVIVFAPPSGGGLRVMPAAGGEPVILTTAAAGARHRFPAFLPDGEHFLYTSEGGPNPGIFVASLHNPVGRRLLGDPSSAIYAPAVTGGDGYLVFAREGRLMARSFDPDGLAFHGDAIVLAERGLPGDNGAVAVSVSDNGVLTYLGGSNRETDSRLFWVDRNGTVIGAIGPTGPPAPVSLSPDGRTAALVRRPAGSALGDVWLWSLDRDLGVPLTPDSTIPNGANVVWSPDGRRVAFTSGTGAATSIVVRDVTGGTTDTLVQVGPPRIVTDWSPSGYLLYTERDPKTGSDLWYVRSAGDDSARAQPVAFRHDRFDTSFGQLSPDGRWIAYISNEAGGSGVWVQAFPTGAGAWLVGEGGQQPRWSSDGRELFYGGGSAGEPALMVASVRTPPTPGASPLAEPRPLFVFELRANSYAPFWGTFFYDVSRDGRRFLIDAVETRSAPVIHVAIGWEHQNQRAGR